MENFPVKHLQSNLFRAFFIYFFFLLLLGGEGGGGAGAKFQLQSVTYTAKIQQNRV